MNHLFLTATMILCSLLHMKQTMGRDEEICAALRRTRKVWIRRSGGSGEARKAAETVGFVLGKAGEGGAYSGFDEAAGSAQSMRSGSLETPSTQNFQGPTGFYDCKPPSSY
jgi:hypothetical protein